MGRDGAGYEKMIFSQFLRNYSIMDFSIDVLTAAMYINPGGIRRVQKR
jgi:hypothetical protein